MVKTALDYAKAGCDTLIRKYTPDKLPPNDQFLYHQGVFLSGMQKTYALSGDKKYFQYVKDWLDYNIDENGFVPQADIRQFDKMQPAVLLFDMLKQTGDIRYKKVLDSFVNIIEQWPKNARGGFWHKYFHPNQMWLDGLYMIGPYMMQYAHEFKHDYFIETSYRQMKLMTENMKDSETGLLYHAWDDSKRMPWANKETGLSPDFWGRAIGWYAVAIADIIDYIPSDDPRRQEFINAELSLIDSLVKYQDKNDGRWYQVVNMVDDPRNWHENSCSCMFIYAIAKMRCSGLLDESYDVYMHSGYNGVINSLSFDGDNLLLSDVCVGTGVGNYEYYFDRKTSVNDLHGMGAFVLMCTEYHKLTGR